MYRTWVQVPAPASAPGKFDANDLSGLLDSQTHTTPPSILNKSFKKKK